MFKTKHETTYRTRSMKPFLLFFLLLLSAGKLYAQVQFPIDGTEASNQFFKALQEKDDKTLDNLLTHDFSAVSFQGQTISRDQLRQISAQGYLFIESGFLSGANTRNYRDVAIVTGQWDVQAKLQNQSFNGRLSYLTVCVRSGGKWQVATVQLTPIL
jgi:hypothetical protein